MSEPTKTAEQKIEQIALDLFHHFGDGSSPCPPEKLSEFQDAIWQAISVFCDEVEDRAKKNTGWGNRMTDQGLAFHDLRKEMGIEMEI